MKPFLLIVGLFLASMIANGPKFRYLDKTFPIYIHVKGLTPDTDDAVSGFVKDSLHKIGIIIISSKENAERVKQYYKDATDNLPTLTRDDFKSMDATNRKMFSNATPWQSLTILYTSPNDSTGNYETCDSIGFRYVKMPTNSFPPRFPRIMFPMKEIGSRMPDSIGRFLMKKM
jgi:hypothetical protein